MDRRSKPAPSYREDPAWRLVEQYEARLQFAAEFVDPSAQLRRLRPDSLVYSYEWFEDDVRVLEAIERFAHLPVTLPHGWTLADATRPTAHYDQVAFFPGEIGQEFVTSGVFDFDGAVFADLWKSPRRSRADFEAYVRYHLSDHVRCGRSSALRDAREPDDDDGPAGVNNPRWSRPSPSTPDVYRVEASQCTLRAVRIKRMASFWTAVATWAPSRGWGIGAAVVALAVATWAPCRPRFGWRAGAGAGGHPNPRHL